MQMISLIVLPAGVADPRADDAIIGMSVNLTPRRAPSVSVPAAEASGEWRKVWSAGGALRPCCCKKWTEVRQLRHDQGQHADQDTSAQQFGLVWFG